MRRSQQRALVQRFTKNVGIAEHAVGSINTLVKVPGRMLAAEATLAEATPAEMAGTRMYGLADLGRLVSREGTAVTGFGPIGLPAMAKSHAASPVDLFSTREDRNSIGLELGANVLVDTRSEAALARAKDLTDNKAAEQESDCTRTEATINQALHKINRRGKACLVVSPKLPGELDPGCLAVDNFYVDGTRTEGGSRPPMGRWRA